MKKLKILILFVLMTSTLLHSQKIKYEEGKVYRHQLENGLVVLTMERHLAPYIYHQLTYRVGSRNERLGITGISHVVEHMMFKGTEKYPKGVTSKTISKNGGVFNAFTMNDMTSYYEYLPKNKIELAMDIESDRMMNCIFDPEEFKSEIEVIIQERRMRIESTSNGIANEMMNAIAFDSHPNRDPVIGWPYDLKNITRDDAYTYYKTFYIPNNAFLVLVGDFETEKILELVKKYYGKIPKGPEIPQLKIGEQNQVVRKTFTLYHNDITQPTLRMAFHVPNYEHPDAPALKLVQRLFTAKARSARLYDRLVEKEKVATMAAGGFGFTKDPTLYQITVVLKPDAKVDSVEKIVWEEIKKLQDSLVTEKELQKAKNRFRFDELTSYTKNADIGSRISLYENYVNYEFIDTFSNRVKAVTREDIQRVMKKYFNPEQVTVAYLYPKGPVKKQDEKEEENEENGEEEKIELYDSKFYFKLPNEIFDLMIQVDEEDYKDILKPIPIAPLVKSLKLKNGITVYTIENHLTPSIYIGGVIQPGYIEEAIGNNKPGIVDLLSDVINRGPKNMTYEEFIEKASFVPFQFSVQGNYRRIYFQGYCLKENLDEMMQTGLDILKAPRFDDKEIEDLRNRNLIQAKNRYKRTSVKAFYYMFNKIFDGHPYSQYLSTEESLNKITKQDLIDLWNKYFQPKLMSVVILGDYSHKEMQKIAEKYFSDFKSKNQPPDYKVMPKVKPLEGKEIKVFPEKDYTQCTINIGFSPFNDIPDDEEDAVNVLNYILASSALTSRIGVNLRDKQGLIYGIKSELWKTTDGIGYWKFNTKTAPQNVDKVIKGIFSEIKNLIENGITDEELKTAKVRLLSLLPLYVETPDDIASRVFELIQDGKPLDYFDKKADRIIKVTKNDVVKLAKKYFTLDRFIIVIDGPIEQKDVDGLIEQL
ncbi:MAG: M16 family metallopeptidase [Ignavibacteria bacterium]